VEDDWDTTRGRLPGRFTSRESTADDVHHGPMIPGRGREVPFS
jgi:hypothetical protein